MVGLINVLKAIAAKKGEEYLPYWRILYTEPARRYGERNYVVIHNHMKLLKVQVFILGEPFLYMYEWPGKRVCKIPGLKIVSSYTGKGI